MFIDKLVFPTNWTENKNERHVNTNQGVNKEFASARAEKIFEQLDEDGNGELSEEEFCRWERIFWR